MIAKLFVKSTLVDVFAHAILGHACWLIIDKPTATQTG